MNNEWVKLMMGRVPIYTFGHEASPFGVKLIDSQTITVNVTSTLIFLCEKAVKFEQESPWIETYDKCKQLRTIYDFYNAV